MSIPTHTWSMGDTSAQRVTAFVSLYPNFINLFLILLRIQGGCRT